MLSFPGSPCDQSCLLGLLRLPDVSPSRDMLFSPLDPLNSGLVCGSKPDTSTDAEVPMRLSDRWLRLACCVDRAMSRCRVWMDAEAPLSAALPEDDSS